jgi:hypothetical protein
MAFVTPIRDAVNISRSSKTISDIKDENDKASENILQRREDLPDDPEPQSFSSQDRDVEESKDISYAESKRSSQIEDMYGAPSIFNKNAIFVHPKSYDSSGFKKLKDRRGQEKIYSTDDPEVATIIQQLKEDTKRRLHFADFAFHKHYDIVPTNRLMVLRRFPFPTYNNLSFSGRNEGDDKIQPISKAITYFGEGTDNDISEILKISGYKEYKELTADLDFIQGVDKSASDTPFFNNLGSTAQKGLNAFSALAGKGDISGRQKERVEQMLGKNWENDRRGPENVVHKTHIADVGVGATLEFTLVFEYSLRSWNGVNPRVALMDLISNIMTLVHTNAEFWGGQNVVLPNHQKFPFIGNEDDFYSGNYGSYLSSVVDWFTEPFASGGGIQGLLDGIMSGDLSSLGSILGKIGGTALDLSSSKSRSSVIGMKSLLDSSPIGNYHLSIGNPLNPWATIGNLICPAFRISVEKGIGHHGSINGIKLEADLKTATPLDSTGVQGIFANGLVSNRMYMKPLDFFEATGVVKNGDLKITPEEIKRLEGWIF